VLNFIGITTVECPRQGLNIARSPRASARPSARADQRAVHSGGGVTKRPDALVMVILAPSHGLSLSPSGLSDLGNRDPLLAARLCLPRRRGTLMVGREGKPHPRSSQYC